MPDQVVCRKWTLFSLCMVQIILILVLCVLVDFLHPTSTSDGQAKQAAGVIALGIGTILFDVLALLGWFLQDSQVMLTYAVCMCMVTLGCVGVAILTWCYWSAFAVNLAITVVASLYARDLDKLDPQDSKDFSAINKLFSGEIMKHK